MKRVDLIELDADLHNARHKEGLMAEWARRNGRELLNETEQLRKLVDLTWHAIGLPLEIDWCNVAFILDGRLGTVQRDLRTLKRLRKKGKKQ